MPWSRLHRAANSQREPASCERRAGAAVRAGPGAGKPQPGFPQLHPLIKATPRLSQSQRWMPGSREECGLRASAPASIARMRRGGSRTVTGERLAGDRHLGEQS